MIPFEKRRGQGEDTEAQSHARGNRPRVSATSTECLLMAYPVKSVNLVPKSKMIEVVGGARHRVAVFFY